MAPRTRSNRIEMLARRELLASGQPLNTKGLPALPDELYLEIVSHLPTIPVPTLDGRSLDVESRRYRYQTLLSLTQTCCSLRRVFLRYLWQRIEVYDGMVTSEGTLGNAGARRHSHTSATHVNKKHAKELVRQLEVVTIRDPSLAIHVNIVNVSVVEYSVNTVMLELARCIALFPNLHTVQLNFKINYIHQTFLQLIFSCRSYPQIRTVSLSWAAKPFLLACPGVRHLTPYLNCSWDGFVDDAVLCPQVEVLGVVAFGIQTINTMAKKLLNLRDITLDRLLLRLGFDNLKPLLGLANLQIIRLRMDIVSYRGYHFIDIPGANGVDYSRATVPELHFWIKWAKEILTSNQNAEIVDKQVIMTYADGLVEIIHC